MKAVVFEALLTIYVLVALIVIMLMVWINVQLNRAVAGASGICGGHGLSGSAGAQGSPGASGISGGSGACGPSGGPGPSGLFGAQGKSGPSGIPGASGPAGDRGPSGGSGTTGFPATDTLNNFAALWCAWLPGPNQIAWDNIHRKYSYESAAGSGQVQYGGQQSKTTASIGVQVGSTYWAGTMIPFDRFVFSNSLSTAGWAVDNSDDIFLTLTSGINHNDTLLFANNSVTMGTYLVTLTINDVTGSFCSVLLDNKEITTGQVIEYANGRTPPVLPYTFQNQNGWLPVNLQRNLSRFTAGASGSAGYGLGPSGNNPFGVSPLSDFTWTGFVGVGPSGPHTLNFFYQSGTLNTANSQPAARTSIPQDIRCPRGSLTIQRISSVVLT